MSTRPRVSLLAALTVLAGCGGLLETDRPAVSTYTLDPPAGGSAAPDAGAPILEITALNPAPGLATDRILLWRQPMHLEHFAAVRWADTAPELVRDFLRASFAHGQDMLDVADADAMGVGDYRLRGELREFHADYTDGSPPTVRVSVRARLIDGNSRERLAVFAVSATADALDNTVTSVVRAFDEATVEVAGTLLGEIIAAIEKSTVAAARHE